MAISYVNADQKVTAESKNAIFEELDAKLDSILSGTSFLIHTYAVTQVKPYLGMLFYFGHGQTQFADLWGRADRDDAEYDHNIFTDYVESASIGTSDETLLSAVLDSPSSATIAQLDKHYQNHGTNYLDYSLEPHRKLFTPAGGEEAHYWVRHQNSEYSKQYRYALAEVVLEGTGSEELNWREEWTKFNCYRIHNLNQFSCTVHFPGLDVTVPKYGSKCVRRLPGTEEYTIGYKYFQKYIAGDHILFKWPYQNNTTPTGTLGANNLTNPALMYGLMRLFENVNGLASGGVGAPRIKRDHHETYDIGSFYTDFYPAVADSVIIGDLLHHKGDLTIVEHLGGGAYNRQTYSFNGYRDLLADAGSIGVSATENSNGTIEIVGADATQRDIVCHDTNLLMFEGTALSAADLSSARALYDAKPGDFDPSFHPVRSVVINEENQEETYDTTTLSSTDDAVVSQVQSVFAETKYLRKKNSSEAPGKRLANHRDTVEDVKTLAAWGDPSQADQDTAYGTFENRQVELTPWGLVLKFIENIPLNYPGQDLYLPPANSIVKIYEGTTVDGYRWDLDGATLTRKFAYYWTGYGWPDIRSDDGAFFSPRRKRQYSLLEVHETGSFGTTWRHPHVRKDPVGFDGADWTHRTIHRSDLAIRDVRSLRKVTWTEPNELTTFPFTHWVIEDPDILREWDINKDSDSWYDANRIRVLSDTPDNNATNHWMLWLPILREHHNAMIAFVNSIKQASQFTFDRLNFRDADRNTIQLRSNNTGLFGTTVRPVKHYRTLDSEDDQYTLADKLGIRIRTFSDLPGSIRSHFGVPLQQQYGNQWNINLQYHKVNKGLVSERFLGGTSFERIYDVRVELLGEETSIINGVPADQKTMLERAFDLPAFSQRDAPEYLWLHVDDVIAVAENYGLPLIVDRPVTLLALNQYNAQTPVLRQQNKSEYDDQLRFVVQLVGDALPPEKPPGFIWTIEEFPLLYPSEATLQSSPQRQYAALVPLAEYVENEDWENESGQLDLEEAGDPVDWDVQTPAEFIRDEAFIRVVDNDAADEYATLIGAEQFRLIWIMEMPMAWRRLQEGSLIRSATFAPGYQGPAAAWQLYASIGADTPATTAIKIPVAWFDHDTKTWTRDSFKNGISRLQIGGTVITIVARGTGSAATETLACGDGVTIVPASAGPIATDVVFHRSEPLQL